MIRVSHIIKYKDIKSDVKISHDVMKHDITSHLASDSNASLRVVVHEDSKWADRFD